jgi:hypothetical protein
MPSALLGAAATSSSLTAVLRSEDVSTLSQIPLAPSGAGHYRLHGLIMFALNEIEAVR